MSDFPISPSDLPWWGWLLGAGFAWFLGFLIRMFSTDEDGCLELCVVAVFALAGLLCFGIGSIRFVKWVWGG